MIILRPFTVFEAAGKGKSKNASYIGNALSAEVEGGVPLLIVICACISPSKSETKHVNYI